MAKDIKTKEDLKRYFDDFRDCTFMAIVEVFARIGEEAVTKAREDHVNNWKDQTGNLRSSIGYIVTYEGKEVHKSGFYPTPTELGNGEEGQKEGKKVVEGLKGTQTEGFALIVVAGMNYAESVEARGKDVLAGAELHARNAIPKYLKRVPERIKYLMKEKKGW